MKTDKILTFNNFLSSITYKNRDGENLDDNMGDKLRDLLNRFKSRYNYEMRTTFFPPSTIWIEPTNHCNLKCIMCPQSIMRRKRGMMKFWLFKKIINEIRFWQPTIKLYHLGESLLHPKIFEMIKYAKNAGYTVFHTNATLLNKRKTSKCLKSGLSEISFSFDGVTEETYESIRKNADFDRTLKNIIYFLDAKKRNGGKEPYTIVEIIEMKNTQSEIKSFLETFKSLPVNEVRITTLMDWAGKINVSDLATSKKLKGKYIPCASVYTNSVILWDGSVVPCCVDFDGEYVAGNVSNEKLIDIWNNDKMKFLRKSLAIRNRQKIGLCKHCENLWASISHTWRDDIINSSIKVTKRFKLNQMLEKI